MDEANQRERVANEVLARWRQSATAEQPAKRLLIDESGRLEREGVERLLQGRDDRPINLIE